MCGHSNGARDVVGMVAYVLRIQGQRALSFACRCCTPRSAPSQSPVCPAPTTFQRGTSPLVESTVLELRHSLAEVVETGRNYGAIDLTLTVGSLNRPKCALEVSSAKFFKAYCSESPLKVLPRKTSYDITLESYLVYASHTLELGSETLLSCSWFTEVVPDTASYEANIP